MAKREPKPPTPKDIAKAMGPYKRLRPKPKKGSIDNDLRLFAKPMPKLSGDFRDMGPRKAPARPMPKRIGGAAIPKPAKRPKPMPKAVIQKPFKRQKPASKRIGNAVVPKAKKMGR